MEKHIKIGRIVRLTCVTIFVLISAWCWCYIHPDVSRMDTRSLREQAVQMKLSGMSSTNPMNLLNISRLDAISRESSIRFEREIQKIKQDELDEVGMQAQLVSK